VNRLASVFLAAFGVKTLTQVAESTVKSSHDRAAVASSIAAERTPLAAVFEATDEAGDFHA
jgi:hypothetical protein